MLKNSRKLGVGIGFALIALTSCAQDAVTLTLVKDGSNPLPIILPKDPTFFNKIAANDLAEYIGKIGGAKPEILEGVPEKVPDAAIWIGDQPEARKRFPSVNFDFEKPEEIAIVTSGPNLLIAGRDRVHPEVSVAKKETIQFATRDVEHVQQEYGTVNAIYTFIQDQLGVRWLWPGEAGTVIPKSETIEIAQMDFRYAPKIRQRHGVLALIAIFRTGAEPKTDAGAWARRQRIQLDSLYVPAAGHGFGKDWLELHESKPELFALQPDGTRTLFPDTLNFKVCEANPELWEIWLSKAKEMAEQNPLRTNFSAAANDAYAGGHCVCPLCVAWDAPEAELRLFNWKNKREARPALSDRQVTLANTLARMLKERYPDKDYTVSILSYGYSRPVPLKNVPDDNVVIIGVNNTISERDMVDDNSPVGTTNFQQMEGWKKISKNYIWRPNVGRKANWQLGGPPDTLGMARNFKESVAGNCVGVHIDQAFMYWATQGPLYYLMAQLAWNPEVDPEAVLKDYCEHGFGPAAEDIRAYLQVLSDARNATMKADGDWGAEDWAAGFTPQRLAEAGRLMTRAREKAKGTEFEERVEFMYAGFEYVSLMTENMALVPQIRAAGGGDSPEKQKATENWKKIEAIAENFPHALNANYVKNRPTQSHIRVIHPDGEPPKPRVRRPDVTKLLAPKATNDLDDF